MKSTAITLLERLHDHESLAYFIDTLSLTAIRCWDVSGVPSETIIPVVNRHGAVLRQQANQQHSKKQRHTLMGMESCLLIVKPSGEVLQLMVPIHVELDKDTNITPAKREEFLDEANTLLQHAIQFFERELRGFDIHTEIIRPSPD